MKFLGYSHHTEKNSWGINFCKITDCLQEKMFWEFNMYELRVQWVFAGWRSTQTGWESHCDLKKCHCIPPPRSSLKSWGPHGNRISRQDHEKGSARNGHLEMCHVIFVPEDRKTDPGTPQAAL